MYWVKLWMNECLWMNEGDMPILVGYTFSKCCIFIYKKLIITYLRVVCQTLSLLYNTVQTLAKIDLIKSITFTSHYKSYHATILKHWLWRNKIIDITSHTIGQLDNGQGHIFSYLNDKINGSWQKFLKFSNIHFQLLQLC